MDLEIKKGKTFKYRIQLSDPENIVYKQITSISNTAPVTLVVPAHEVPDGWLTTVVSARGMKEINAVNVPPDISDYREVSVVDPNTVQFNDVNAADFKAHTANTGYLQYNSPVDLTGADFRMSIKDKVGGTELLRLDVTNARIIPSLVNSHIDLEISATDTAGLDFKAGVYDLEMQLPSGEVDELLSGKIKVINEVTTT